MLRTSLFGALAAAACVVAISPASADVEFEQRGTVGYLHSQHLRPGDEEQVRAYLDGAQGLRIIYFDSRGGNPQAAMAIGQMIRERGLDTGFDPRSGSRCVSACTAMFMGGVRRYYVGGEHIRDAANSRRGLGFHMPRHPTPEGEDAMNGYYAAMGAPGATNLRYHIYPRDSLDQPFEGVGPRGTRMMYFTGSRTAVRAGVATGTVAPPDERD
jgi:hypothetical protein